MQEKKNPPKNLEREREREREPFFFFLRENYAQNRRDSNNFIVKGCEYEETKIKEDEGKEEE